MYVENFIQEKIIIIMKERHSIVLLHIWPKYPFTCVNGPGNISPLHHVLEQIAIALERFVILGQTTFQPFESRAPWGS